jgi:hypothetical protein
MNRYIQRFSVLLVLWLMLSTLARAQEARAVAQSGASNIEQSSEASTISLLSDDKKKAKTDDIKKPVPPSETDKTPASAANTEITDPLIRVLISKGVLSADEGRAIGAGGSPGEQRDRLAALLRTKGLISDAEFEAVRTVAPAMDEVASAREGNPQDTKPQGPATAPKAAATPTVIPAIAPLRPLQVDPSKREGLIPDIQLGSGAKLKLYGFFKASIIHDTSSPAGNDFPLPLLAGDTGPDFSPEFHAKARFFRLGANFEWLDPAPKTAITGRVEVDFEGNFSRVNNRNISSIRSSALQIRLAWMRIDRKLTEKTSVFALLGQDWTPFGSSTLPNIVETTGLGIGFGTLYERLPQARFGVNFDIGGSRKLSFQPEIALVLPAFGDLPVNLADQLGFGERQGADSHRPEYQGRIVTQFQLDKAAGVVPAQLIASFVQGRREAIVTAASVPAAFQAAFPNGVRVGSNRYGYSLEAQLPTRAVTVLAKYYNGEDLRFYFSGQLLSNFNDTAGLTNTASTTSIDGASTVVFGLVDGAPTVAPQRPVRVQGGFLNLGFPLSRIFGADPKGRNAGWTGYLHYGYDQVPARDARRFGARGNRSDVLSGTLFYKLNSFVTFALEESLLRTRAANRAGALPLLRGIPSYSAHDIRSEFATIFTF